MINFRIVVFPAILLLCMFAMPERSHIVASASELDVLESTDAMIIGGEVAEPGAWPWQIAMEFRGTGSLICGGVLISAEWVITAAHCPHIVNFNPDSFQIRLGIHNRATDFGVVIYPAEVFVHENALQELPPDIALIRLSNTVVLTDLIQPVPYASTADPQFYAPGVVGTVTGWGSTSATALVLPNELRQLSLTVRANSKCIADIGAGHYGISDFDICAGQLVATESGCLGDSGGALVTPTSAGKYVMIGIVSRAADTDVNKDCRSYNIFTHIPHSADWIEAVTTVAPYEETPIFVPSNYIFMPLMLQL